MVNAGFSGGEKKRNEILQMAVLEPRLAILDETDSGLDIDALRMVAAGVNQLRRPDNATIVVTHYQRLLNYIVPDVVHVLAGGRIVKSGGKELALELEAKGYDWLTGETEGGVTTSYLRTSRRSARNGGSKSPWLTGLRRAASSASPPRAFPVRREEDWRFTNLAPITGTELSAGPGPGDRGRPRRMCARFLYSIPGGSTLVFVNGRFSPRPLDRVAAPGRGCNGHQSRCGVRHPRQTAR